MMGGQYSQFYILTISKETLPKDNNENNYWTQPTHDSMGGRRLHNGDGKTG